MNLNIWIDFATIFLAALFTAILLTPIYTSINRKYYFRDKILFALPKPNDLYEYQKGVMAISKNISIKRKGYLDRYRKVVTPNKHNLFIFSMVYKLLWSRYYCYTQFATVYISSYGNISEVSRRKFSTGESIQKLKSIDSKLRTALYTNNLYGITHNLANIYRAMYDIQCRYKGEWVGTKLLNLRIKEIKSSVNNNDIVKAYIDWRELESEMPNMSDIEVLIFGTIRLHLEKYIMAYRYPLNADAVFTDFNNLNKVLEFLIYWSENKYNTFKTNFLLRVRNKVVLYLVMDMLNYGLNNTGDNCAI